MWFEKRTASLELTKQFRDIQCTNIEKEIGLTAHVEFILNAKYYQNPMLKHQQQ